MHGHIPEDVDRDHAHFAAPHTDVAPRICCDADNAFSPVPAVPSIENEIATVASASAASLDDGVASHSLLGEAAGDVHSTSRPANGASSGDLNRSAIAAVGDATLSRSAVGDA